MEEKVLLRVPAEISVQLTMQDVDDIMVCALEGGINYWCSKAEVVGEYLGEYASDQISRGGKLTLVLDEPLCENDTLAYELDLEKFASGVKRWLSNGGIASCDISNEGAILDCCCIDGYDADSILQYALFGEVVFG